MRSDARWLVGVALLFTVGCSDGGTGPAGENDGARLAAQFEQLADSVDGSGYSPTAEALRHAAEIVRLTGHATPVALTIDGTSRSFLAVGEQLDIPNLVCSLALGQRIHASGRHRRGSPRWRRGDRHRLRIPTADVHGQRAGVGTRCPIHRRYLSAPSRARSRCGRSSPGSPNG